MNKQIIRTEPYLLVADKYGIDRHEFLNVYIPKFVNSSANPFQFTSIGNEEIEFDVGIVFPSPESMENFAQIEQQTIKKDFGVFERTYEDGVLVRETYVLPAVKQEAIDLLSKLPSSVNVDGAFSIGMRDASGPYQAAYITLYFAGEFESMNNVSYALKIDAATGDLLQTKLIFDKVPPNHAAFVPSNAAAALYGVFVNDSASVDVYFSFNTEKEYADYLQSNYYKPPYSVIGLGMVGLTIDVASNTISRIKRYVF